MLHKKKIAVSLITIVLLSACGLDFTKVDINLEDGFTPEVALSGYLVPDSLIRLKLLMTRAAYSTKRTQVIVKSATIERTNDNQSFSLHQKSIGTDIELSSYELITKEGGIYKLHLETLNPASILESIDTIPTVTPIIYAEVLPVEKSISQLGQIKFKPNSNSIGTSFYELAIFICNKSGSHPTNIFYQASLTTNNQIITHEDYYPSILLIGALEPQSLLFRVNNPDEIINISFLYSGGAMSSSNGLSSMDHELRIELRSVSFAYFKYKTSLYKQGYAANGDLLYGMAAPVAVTGNIKGGLGIFSGYSKSDTIIRVAGRTGLTE